MFDFWVLLYITNKVLSKKSILLSSFGKSNYLSWNGSIIKSLYLHASSISNYFSENSFEDLLGNWQEGFVFSQSLILKQNLDKQLIFYRTNWTDTSTRYALKLTMLARIFLVSRFSLGKLIYNWGHPTKCVLVEVFPYLTVHALLIASLCHNCWLWSRIN